MTIQIGDIVKVKPLGTIRGGNINRDNTGKTGVVTFVTGPHRNVKFPESANIRGHGGPTIVLGYVRTNTSNWYFYEDELEKINLE